MKHHTGSIYVTLAVAGVLFACSASSADKTAPADAKGKPAGLSTEEKMKKAEAAGKPGRAHMALDALVGDWNVVGRCWMAPDGPPTENKGTSKKSWILGDRFVQEEFRGEFMGKPFNGIGLIGYDNMRKKYVSSWVDDMSTALFTVEGTADAENRVFTFLGRMDDAMTGQMSKPIKIVIRFLDSNRYTFEMHDLTLGEKSKTMEMSYSRKL